MKIYAWIENGRHRQKKMTTPPDATQWICFDPALHTYTDERGRYYKSVTRFLADIDDRPFNAELAAIECASQLEGDYANMSPAEIMQQWMDTADAGTEAHEAIEAEVNGEWQDNPDNPLLPIVDQFRFWKASHRAKMKSKSECIFWSPSLRLAGTADLVSWGGGLVIIDDIKTWKKLTDERKKKAAQQITLYCSFVRELLGREAIGGGVLMFENYYTLRDRTPLTYVEVKDQGEQMQPAIWAREYECRYMEEKEVALQISGGKKSSPRRVVIHGVEGVGKSTFASRFPSPVFIDTEGSTDEMDVQRLPSPKDWAEAKQLLADVRDEKSVDFKTLVIDTIDWLEDKGAEAVAKSKNKKRLADVGFGKGELALAEEIKGVLNILDAIQEKHGVHIVLTAHTAVKRFDPPDMPEGFDRYELKLRKHTSPLIREWCNLLLFANFVSEQKEGETGKIKGVADGSKRIMYTTRTDAYDAKNRCGLEPAMVFAYKNIKHVIEEKN